MRILVTGGAGYIGSHAVRLFLSLGHDVWVYDNLTFGHAAAVPEERLIAADLAERERLATVLRDKQIEAVVHFAAYAYVGESVEQPLKYYRNNVINTLGLLEAMRATDVQKLVFSSTCATYGIPETIPITEATSQQPINPYGRSKLMVEQALADCNRAFGLSYAALRYFNAAGAHPSGEIGEDHQPESHLIPLILQTIMGQREAIHVFGTDYPTPDGTCIRDYIHVDDLATAHLAALESLQPGKALKLNLGTGRGYSVREVIDVCTTVAGCPANVIEGPRRPGDPPALVASAVEAEQVLNWKPQYTRLEDIIETAWRWHRSHPKGYKS
jgi:UDP-glucose 4-epimerase